MSVYLIRVVQIVHKALEREVRPEEVHVKPTTDEERWALRFVYTVPTSNLYNIDLGVYFQADRHAFVLRVFDDLGMRGSFFSFPYYLV